MLRLFIFVAIALVFLTIAEKGFKGRSLSASSIAGGFEQIGEKTWDAIKNIGK